MKPMKGLEKVKSKLEPFKDETPMETDEKEVKQEKVEKSSSKVKPAKKSGKIDFSKAKPKTVKEEKSKSAQPEKAPVKKSKIHPKIMDSESSGNDEPPEPKEHEITKRFFENKKKKNLTTMGLEPTIFRFEVERVIHYATRPWY